MNPHEQPCQATPSGDLRQQILDSRVPKNEREWWAAREIEKLERELAVAENWVEHHAKHADDLIGENVRLRAEVERFKEWLADPHTLHAHCLRTLTDGQIAHLFGERMTEIVNRADKAEAECVRLKSLGRWAHTCVHHNDAERKAAMCCPVCEQTRSQKIETALKDAISTYFGNDKLVTAERIEAWQAALKDNK